MNTPILIKSKIFLLFFALANVPSFAQTFSDHTFAAGINHVYDQFIGIGGGCAWFDYDADGDEDLYVTGGNDLDRLYSNNGDGTFTDVSYLAGLNLTDFFYTTSVTTGDIDNDGFRDIFVGTYEADGTSNPARNLFYKNNGDGTFIEQAQFAGLDGYSFTCGATFLDYDQDGYLDLYVANYFEQGGPIVEDANGNEIGFDHTCFENYFYRNNGDGTFTDLTNQAGVGGIGCSLAAAATDYNLDGKIDIYLANDFGNTVQPNLMYHNNYPSNNFTDVGPATNSDIGIFGMGIAIGDYDLDGDFDYYISNLGRNVFLERVGSNYVDVATAAGVENTYAADSPGDKFATSWGTEMLDFNNDKYPDLFVCNGHIAAANFIGTGEMDPNKLYMNNGDKTFTNISGFSGIDDTNRGRGMASADYDMDGDLDIFTVVQQWSITPLAKSILYRNDLTNGNNFIRYKLQGVNTNRDAFGSKVYVYTGGNCLIQEIDGGNSSHASQRSSILHFGLGTETTVDSVKIHWMGQGTETIYTPTINETHFVIENAVLLAHELLNFDAKGNHDHILLDWTTSFENDNKGFFVQRTTGLNQAFETLGFIESKGNNAQSTKYQFQDFSAKPGITYYYRLEHRNLLEQKGYSSIIEAALIQGDAAGIQFYPNPTTSKITFEATAFEADEILNVRLFNLEGKLVLSTQLKANQASLNLEHIAKGAYILKAKNRTQHHIERLLIH